MHIALSGGTWQKGGKGSPTWGSRQRCQENGERSQVWAKHREAEAQVGIAPNHSMASDASVTNQRARAGVRRVEMGDDRSFFAFGRRASRGCVGRRRWGGVKRREEAAAPGPYLIWGRLDWANCKSSIPNRRRPPRFIPSTPDAACDERAGAGAGRDACSNCQETSLLSSRCICDKKQPPAAIPKHRKRGSPNVDAVTGSHWMTDVPQTAAIDGRSQWLGRWMKRWPRFAASQALSHPCATLAASPHPPGCHDLPKPLISRWAIVHAVP